MNVPLFLIQWAHTLSIYSIGDCLQIIFFIAIVYRFLLFLDIRATHSLLNYFTLWSCTFMISHWYCQQPLSLFLLCMGPLLICSLLILHQERIQKNVIASHKRVQKPEKFPSPHWIDILVKECLRASMHNNTIHILIQRTDHIEDLIEIPIHLNTPINESLWTFLMNAITYSPHTCLLLQDQGTVLGLNVEWAQLHGTIDWYSFSRNITTHNDTITLSCDQASMLFHITAQGKTLHNISATELTRILKNMIIKSSKETHENEFIAAQSQQHTQAVP